MTYSPEAEARWATNQLNAYLNAQERSEEAAEAAREEWGEDYEQNERDPEDRDLIPESMVSLVSEQDRADLACVLDYEQHSLTL